MKSVDLIEKKKLKVFFFYKLEATREKVHEKY
jgi:hypothetical protein